MKKLFFFSVGHNELNFKRHNQVSFICPIFYCSDFRYESKGIFVLGVGFFFFRQISTF